MFNNYVRFVKGYKNTVVKPSPLSTFLKKRLCNCTLWYWNQDCEQLLSKIFWPSAVATICLQCLYSSTRLRFEMNTKFIGSTTFPCLHAIIIVRNGRAWRRVWKFKNVWDDRSHNFSIFFPMWIMNCMIISSIYI